ncbi:MAG TPA: EexN family lipoprotein [Woeseiaceae bacterium]|nr:EexN family lipoprotein [Woeseiaceae bacterium]
MSERRARGTCVAALCAASLLAACGEEPPPPSPNEFIENRILLEATMVRCSQNRAEARYDAECINAREAVNRLAAAEEQAKRQDLEAQSERKRQALRRAQEAAAEARRRALVEEQRRRDAELLGEFEPLLTDETAGETNDVIDDVPDDVTDDQTGRDLPPPAGTGNNEHTDPSDNDDTSDDTATTPLPRSAAGPIPDASASEDPYSDSTDLEAIRRELERRQGESMDEAQQ